MKRNATACGRKLSQRHEVRPCSHFMPDTADFGIWHDVCGRCRYAFEEIGVARLSKSEAAQ